MADLVLQDASQGAPIDLVVAAAGGDTIPAGVKAANWGLRVVLVVRNDDAGTGTAKIVTVEGHPPVTVDVLGGTAVIPAYAGIYYGSRKSVTYSPDVNALTVAAVGLTGVLD